MYIETWYKIWCDKCDAINWLCDGDTSDMTQSDVEGFVCFKCCHTHRLDKITIPSYNPQDYETGLEQPL